jgi:hypothetical protein
MPLCRRPAVIALLAIVASIQGKAQSMRSPLPGQILLDLPWSFKEPVAATLAAFMSDVRNYCASINMPFNESEMSARLPVASVDVEYEYWVRRPSGEWGSTQEVIRIRPSRAPTYGELLYAVHAAAHPRLSQQDHCFFEGFRLLEREHEKGVPAYELLVGS